MRECPNASKLVSDTELPIDLQSNKPMVAWFQQEVGGYDVSQNRHLEVRKIK